jgi:uncharacterized protein (DUF58 family)
MLAASLADRGLRARRSVGLLASGKVPIWMRPDSGEHRRWEILRALALVEPGETPLSGLLESTGSLIGHQASLIVITSSIEDDWLKPLVNLIWRGFNPTVIMIDPSTFETPERANTNTRVLDKLLVEMNIPHHIVTHDLFKQPDARPGPQGQWEWRIMPTGKAVPIRMPGDRTWKSLG